MPSTVIEGWNHVFRYFHIGPNRNDNVPFRVRGAPKVDFYSHPTNELDIQQLNVVKLGETTQRRDFTAHPIVESGHFMTGSDALVR